MSRSSRKVVNALTAAKSSFRGVALPSDLGKRSLATKTPITMMPEGPEVRTLVDQVQGGVGMRLCDIRFLSGRYVRHGKPDGFQAFSKTMTPISDEKEDNEQVDLIQEWNAKGKFIYIILDSGSNAPKHDDDFQRSIWITLGMSGRFVSETVHSQQGSQHARWYLELLDLETNQKRKIYYHDARNFGTLKFCLSANALADKLNKKLGPDILDLATTEDTFVEIIENQKNDLNICKFLMNQAKIAGVGNYILSEALYRSGVDPFASLSEIDTAKQRILFRELQSVALESYNAQGLSRKGGTFRDVEGKRGRFEFDLQCYGREFCFRGKPVVKEMVGPHGRAIWYVEDQLFVPRIMRYGGTESEEDGDEEDGGMKDDDDSDEPSLDTQGSVERLFSGITDLSWKEALSEATQSESFHNLVTFLEKEKARGSVVYPPEEDIFSALNLCPLDKVKVVIVGQDPYHGPGQGHGLAFSVRVGVKPPPSLKNIFEEAMSDEGIREPPHGNLDCWAKQGVLLLNAILTVRKGQANSHAKQGWEEFTDAVIKTLNDRREGLVFLLWGNPAAKKASGVDDSKHVIIRTSHPSPLGATKTSSPFFGSKCFSRTNAALVEAGKEPIDWNVY